MIKLCECGCGQPAPLAAATHRRRGHVKGEPMRFVAGHNTRGIKRSEATREKMAAYARARPVEHHERLVAAAQDRSLKPDATAGRIHNWLSTHHPKTGRCAKCGREGATDYAFLRHPEPHTRDIADYRELCRSCHMRFDLAHGGRSIDRVRQNFERARAARWLRPDEATA